MLEPDYRDIFSELFDAQVDFLVVGAFAMAAHGMLRATGDIDIWVRPNPSNAARVWEALARYGAPISQLTQEELAQPGMFFQIGVAPRRIDLLTDIDGVTFDDAWAEREYRSVEGLTIPVISRRHLKINKQAVGRPKDLADVAWIEEREK
ncbi:MAG TPA: nucleotidyltransferase [Longimicrobium sp.]|nr:nucleotidyltransferase [Longimicrobium sp.]